MSNWFSSLPSGLEDLKNKVQAAIPIDAETIQKLTLNTPELQAERQAMDAEYKHKVAVKDSLAHMYPWDTRDAERDILVEECKEAIMGLSANVDTFFGPYPMPKLNVNTEEEKTEEEELLEEEDEEEAEKQVKDKKPSPESLEKLAKLEPLPSLLSDFDLHAHVGLIQKMLRADPTLVERQSSLSGGGEREQIFWRNYFFHCAFTRYEAGLSIDEIWSDQPPPPPPTTTVDGDAAEEKVTVEEETVDFEKTSAITPPQTSSPPCSSNDGTPVVVDVASSKSSSPSNEFEIVDAATGGGSDLDDTDEDAFGGEMDELEAEIARELEN